MKLNLQCLKVVVAFLALFAYFYPIAFKNIPFDTGVILYVVSFLYFIMHYLRHLDKRFFSVYIWALVLLIVGVLSTTVFNDAFDFGIFRVIISIILYSFAAFLVVDLIYKASASFSFYTILEWIIYVAFIQAILSLIIFFTPALKEVYLDIIKRQNELAEYVAIRESSFRLMAVAKIQYANMAVMYGIALLGGVTLPFSKESKLYKHKLLYFTSLIVISVAGILTARTFFLILIGVLLYLWYLLWKKNGLISIFKVLLTILTILTLFFLSMSLLKDSEYISTYNWAFEWYFSLRENGTFETTSTNTLKSMFIFPDNIKTWLLGDGRLNAANGGFYKNTDVGYFRNLFYWGIIGSLLFYFVQYQYFLITKKTTHQILIKRFLGFIMIWVLIYNFKEFWYANIYWALFLVTLLKIKNEKYKIIKNDIGMYGHL
nr:hypothetical protein [Odoribacter splanchnicus]